MLIHLQFSIHGDGISLRPLYRVHGDKPPVPGIIETGFGIVHPQHRVVLVAGVILHQIQFPLAALEDGVVGDLAPLIVVGPALHLAAHRAGQVVYRS